MQSHIETYYRVNGALPITLEDAYDSGLAAPNAPEARPDYEYTLLSSSSFELCATFASNTPQSMRATYAPSRGEVIANPYDWDHGDGRVCFERVVNQ